MADREKVLKGLEHHRHLEASRNELGHDECFDCPYRPYGEDTCASLDRMIDDVLELLKEQKRKKGSWDYGTKCSVCKGTIIPPKDRKVRVNFCPWCGADMRDSYEREGR